MWDHRCDQCNTPIKQKLEKNVVNDVKCTKCGLEFQLIPYRVKK